MAKYKLQDEGVKDVERNCYIPNAPGNRDWQDYLAWLDEGNEPDPMFTPEEVVANEKIQRQAGRIQQLRDAFMDQFEMILALYQAGVDKGVWTAQDFPQSLRSKAAEWKQLIDDFRAEEG